LTENAFEFCYIIHFQNMFWGGIFFQITQFVNKYFFNLFFVIKYFYDNKKYYISLPFKYLFIEYNIYFKNITLIIINSSFYGFYNIFSSCMTEGSDK